MEREEREYSDEDEEEVDDLTPLALIKLVELLGDTPRFEGDLFDDPNALANMPRLLLDLAELGLDPCPISQSSSSRPRTIRALAPGSESRPPPAP